MDRVIAAQVYLRICELGSLSAAARALGMSRPMVSRYLEQMENWAGARLIHRSTRRLTLTPAGEKVLLKTRGSPMKSPASASGPTPAAHCASPARTSRQCS